VWRQTPGGLATEHDAGAADVPAAGEPVPRGGPRPTKRQRWALHRRDHGQLRACVQTLTGQPVSTETDEVRTRAHTLFPEETPKLTTVDFLAAAFPTELAASNALGATRAGREPRQHAVETVVATVRSTARGKAPGPSGPRKELLWALTKAGRVARERFVQLLSAAGGVHKMPPVARRALGAAILLLPVKPGGVEAAGVPGLQPNCMPEIIRKLVGKSLMREVLSDARR